MRKVLGASLRSIVGLMSKDYLLLLCISILVAVPIAWWLMEGWLQEFAYHIPLSWWIFAVPSLAVVWVPLVRVSVHTLRAARTNPATSLRYE